MFARLFGPEDDQVLAVIRRNDKDDMVVRVSCKPPGSIFDVSDTEIVILREHEESARKKFAKMTEDDFRVMVKPLYDMAKAATEGE